MRGLLPFDGDSVELFTPKEYIEFKTDKGIIKIPEEYRPVFHLRPWNQEQKDKIALVAERLQDKSNVIKKQASKDLDDMTYKQIVNIEKLFDIGSERFIDVEIKDGSITLEMWKKIPQKIQTSIYMCLSSISGIVSSETVGL